MTSTGKPTVETTYPLSYHLIDLRKRLVYIAIFLLVVFILCFWQSKYVIDFITSPLNNAINEINATLDENIAKFSMGELIEPFLTELKMCFMAALFFSMPFILYQLWKFIAPGLYKSEKRYLVGFVFFATLLFLSGAAFAYYLVFPLGFKFFLSFVVKYQNMEANLSISKYLGFVTKITIAFGIVFELPVINFFLTKVGLVNANTLRKYRSFAIVGIFVIAAIITPPDVISQIAMAIPLLILYEVSILIAVVFDPKKKNKSKASTPSIYE